jgi:serine/threonine protein kinase
VQFKTGVSEELKDLISRCLLLKPEERITIEQIVEHVFFRPLVESVSIVKE